jgi:hypothetical protein
MNKRSARKLTVSRTTVRTITEVATTDLQNAVGGARQATCSCDAHCDVVWSRRVCW